MRIAVQCGRRIRYTGKLELVT